MQALFLCSTTYYSRTIRIFAVLLEKRKRNSNRFPKRGKHKKKMIMKKDANEIMMLQYRIQRYQSMRNGAMCQALNGKLQKLLAKQH